MIHLEGAVVESFYDIFLYSWHHKMTPLLPCVASPPQERRDHTAKAADFQFQDQNPYLNDIELVKAAKAARQMLHLEKNDDDRLAKLRNDAEKERIFGGYGGRFQAALGAIAESRRGSFSADARDQELLRDGEGTQKPFGPGKFTDVVLKAMDARRKGFGASKGTEASPTTPKNGRVEEDASVPPSAVPSVDTSPKMQSTQLRNHVSTKQEPSLVNWSQHGDAHADYQREMRELDSSAHAKQNADSAHTFAAESQYRNSLPTSPSANGVDDRPQFLPALDLPGSSLQTPTTSAAPSMRSQASLQRHDDTTEQTALGPQRTTQEQRPLESETTERSAGTHPSTSARSVEHVNEAIPSKGVEGHPQGNGASSSALPMHVRDYAVSDSASADTTPALAYSQYSTITNPSSKGPDTPPATSVGPTHTPHAPVASTSGSGAVAVAPVNQASASKDPSADQPANTKTLFSHILDPNGKTLTTFKFSSFAERRNMNISSGSSSAGSKPPPKKNWIEGCERHSSYSRTR